MCVCVYVSGALLLSVVTPIVYRYRDIRFGGRCLLTAAHASMHAAVRFHQTSKCCIMHVNVHHINKKSIPLPRAFDSSLLLVSLFAVCRFVSVCVICVHVCCLFAFWIMMSGKRVTWMGMGSIICCNSSRGNLSSLSLPAESYTCTL